MTSPSKDDIAMPSPSEDDTVMTSESTVSTTTAWWTRTFPIPVTRTVKPRPRPPIRTTTVPNRVSTTVSIVIPVTLFGLVLLVGFGLILYSTLAGDRGLFFLTRTSQPLTV